VRPFGISRLLIALRRVDSTKVVVPSPHKAEQDYPRASGCGATNPRRTDDGERNQVYAMSAKGERFVTKGKFRSIGP
jgi:hypothetical protein